ncbi:hypothetical protein D3248_03635 [Leucobacter zeae]|nr:hypothetical protein [Leucobacter zeae]
MTDPVAPSGPVPGAPAGDSALPGTPDAEGWRRLHPLSPLLRGGLFLLVITGIVIANFRDRLVELVVADQFDGADVDVSTDGGITDLIDYLVAEGLLLIAIGALLAIIVLVVVISWISWRFATYRISDEAVEVRRGVLFRNHRRAPLERIQGVNLQRSLFARVLGLTKIEVLTAGQGGKLELSYLGYRDAKTVREQILRTASRKQRGGSVQDQPLVAGGALPGGVDVAAGAERPPAPVGYDGYVHPASSDPLTDRVLDFADADVDAQALQERTLVKVPVGRLVLSIALSWESIIPILLIAAAIVSSIVWEASIAFAIVPLVLAFGGIVFSRFNKGFQFTLSRGRDAVRIGAGLTATLTESIPFGRIHAVEATQPLLWRPLGWWRVRVTTAGHSLAQGGQNAMQNIVLPVGLESDVLRVIDTLLPGTSETEAEMEELRDALAGPGAGFVGAGRGAAWVLWWGRRRAGVRIADADAPEATLRIRRGALVRSLAIMPIVRSQSIQLRRPLVHRMLGLASVQAHTVLGPIRVEMRGIDLDRARAVFDELAETALRVQANDGASPGAER